VREDDMQGVYDMHRLSLHVVGFGDGGSGRRRWIVQGVLRLWRLAVKWPGCLASPMQPGLRRSQPSSAPSTEKWARGVCRRRDPGRPTAARTGSQRLPSGSGC
jgi:hypothetical protein